MQYITTLLIHFKEIIGSDASKKTKRKQWRMQMLLKGEKFNLALIHHRGPMDKEYSCADWEDHY